MDKQQLEYFQVAAHLEQMTRAAEQLNITQPALSSSIKRLEAELGVLLFDRHGRSIVLNEYGEVFLQYTENILAQFDAAAQQLQSMKEAQERSVQLLSPPLELFPGLLEQILASKINLSLNSIHDSEDRIIAKFISKNIDLCITSMPIHSPALSSEVLTSERMAAIVSREHPLAQNEHVSIFSLKNCNFATFREKTGPRRRMEAICSSAGFSPRIMFKGDRLGDILKSIYINDYITLLTEESYQLFIQKEKPYYRDRYRIIQLEEPWCTISRSIYWRTGDIRPAVSEVKQLIVDYFHSEEYYSEVL